MSNNGDNEPMINFSEGKIDLGSRNISSYSVYQELHSLAEAGLIEKREANGGRIYYYLDATEDDMRFGVFIRLREKI